MAANIDLLARYGVRSLFLDVGETKRGGAGGFTPGSASSKWDADRATIVR